MADVSRLPGPNADFWDWQLQGSAGERTRACSSIPTASAARPARPARGPPRPSAPPARAHALRRPRARGTRAVRGLGRTVRGGPRVIYRRRRQTARRHRLLRTSLHVLHMQKGPGHEASGTLLLSTSGSDRGGSPVTVGLRRLLLPLLHAQRLSGEDHRRDRGGVLQRGPGHLDRIDDAGRDQVDVLAGRRVQAMARGQLATLETTTSPSTASPRSTAAARPSRRTMPTPAPGRPSGPRSPSSTCAACAGAVPPAGDDALLNDRAHHRHSVPGCRPSSPRARPRWCHTVP